MKNAAALLDSLNRAGATVEVVDGTPRIRGAKVPNDLLATIKAHRVEVLAEVERRQLQDRHRYGRPPPPDAPELAHEMQLSATDQQQVMAYVFRQPRPVHAWVMRRSVEYFGQGFPVDECEWRACVDTIAWQRSCPGVKAVEFVLDLAGSWSE